MRSYYRTTAAAADKSDADKIEIKHWQIINHMLTNIVRVLTKYKSDADKILFGCWQNTNQMLTKFKNQMPTNYKSENNDRKQLLNILES